ncbi:MAG TPA: hypothetical protein VNA26_00435, partial [Chitinophagaceae bacterium]|nr:hypothetical protein [Chitinophagaceae bacterium]
MRKPVNVKKIFRYGMATAAGICLVLIVVKTYQFIQLSTDKLYNNAFVNYELPVSDSSSEDGVLIENLYRQKNFKVIIKEAKKPRLPDDKTFLLIGIDNLHVDNPFNAIAAFRQIKPSGNYFHEAQYYLSLAYLKNNDYD